MIVVICRKLKKYWAVIVQEALEVLRTTPTEVVLTVCRPPPELQVLSAPPSADTVPAPPPPRRDNPPSTSASSLQLPLKRMESFGVRINIYIYLS